MIHQWIRYVPIKLTIDQFIMAHVEVTVVKKQDAYLNLWSNIYWRMENIRVCRKGVLYNIDGDIFEVEWNQNKSNGK